MTCVRSDLAPPARWTISTAIASLLTLVFVSGCAGDTECTSDADCRDAQRCISNGGVLFASRSCVPIAGDASTGDTGLDARTDDTTPDARDATSPDTADAATDTADATTDEPPRSLSFDSPKDGAVVSGTVNIRASAVDDTRITYTFTVDGERLGTASGENSGVTWETTRTSDGSHTIGVTATNADGLSSQTSISVSVDNTAPTVQITSPSDGDAVSGTVTVSVTATDATSTVSSVDVSANGDRIGSSSSPSPNAAWNTNQQPDGTTTLTAAATDTAGNKSTTDISVVVDNSPPSISIIQPSGGQTISSPGNIEVSASDPVTQVDTIKLAINGSTVTSTSSNNLSWFWDPEQFPDGDNRLTATATDAAGLSAQTYVQVNVDYNPVSFQVQIPTAGFCFSAGQTTTVNYNVSGYDPNRDLELTFTYAGVSNMTTIQAGTWSNSALLSTDWVAPSSTVNSEPLYITAEDDMPEGPADDDRHQVIIPNISVGNCP